MILQDLVLKVALDLILWMLQSSWRANGLGEVVPIEPFKKCEMREISKKRQNNERVSIEVVKRLS